MLHRGAASPPRGATTTWRTARISGTASRRRSGASPTAHGTWRARRIIARAESSRARRRACAQAQAKQLLLPLRGGVSAGQVERRDHHRLQQRVRGPAQLPVLLPVPPFAVRVVLRRAFDPPRVRELLRPAVLDVRRRHLQKPEDQGRVLVGHAHVQAAQVRRGGRRRNGLLRLRRQRVRPRAPLAVPAVREECGARASRAVARGRLHARRGRRARLVRRRRDSPRCAAHVAPPRAAPRARGRRDHDGLAAHRGGQRRARRRDREHDCHPVGHSHVESFRRHVRATPFHHARLVFCRGWRAPRRRVFRHNERARRRRPPLSAATRTCC